MAIQARTLEFYGQYGFADEIIQQGIVVEDARLREGDIEHGAHEVLHFSFNDLGGGLSPHPFALTFAQDYHEKFLVGKLKELGVQIEWNSKLVGFTEESDCVKATVQLQNGKTSEIAAQYIAGCDGAHSQVRQTLGIGFPGGTYDQLFYVADVKLVEGFERDFIFNLGEHILTLMLPVRASGMQRLIGLVPPELTNKEDLTFEDFRDQVEKLVGIHVQEVNWFSKYKVHHRVAEKFRVGRAFLCGDAGHIHSPVGGQGMNTGIGDAINLGWKLAEMLNGRAAASILDSYEPERIGFAQSLVKTTDKVFTPMTAEGVKGEFSRQVIAPLVFSIVTRFAVSRHAMFRVLSQIGIHYPHSPLSEGEAGHVHGGDRLPWVGDRDNFTPLKSLDWQVHVYGRVQEPFADACRELGVALHSFAWSEDVADAGLKEDSSYLVRPDGYVGLAGDQDPEKLREYQRKFALRWLE
jgi:2-polyprenyl-6-methoxyphenol hydroxylase-like FAD-dependent oxidoreductase